MSPIRAATAADIAAIKDLAIDTAMFSVTEAEFVDGLVTGFVDGSLVDGHVVVHEGNQGQVIAAAYYGPEPAGDRVWNLFFLAVTPSEQGDGVGAALTSYVEQTLRQRGPGDAQVLLVETSSTDQYARTRDFYVKQGFIEEARIRRFWGPADDKVTYWKALDPS